MDVGCGKNLEPFVVGQHHEGNYKSASVSGTLEHVVSIFKHVFCVFSFYRVDGHTATLKRFNLRQLQQNNFQRYIANMILKIPRRLLNSFELPQSNLQSHLINNLPRQLLNILLELLNNDILAFPLEKLIIPMAFMVQFIRNGIVDTFPEIFSLLFLEQRTSSPLQRLFSDHLGYVVVIEVVLKIGCFVSFILICKYIVIHPQIVSFVFGRMH